MHRDDGCYSTVMTVVTSRNRDWFLLLIVYAFALINLIFASFAQQVYNASGKTLRLLFHIGLALFSYATMIIAALYVLQLSLIDYLLKNKKLSTVSEMPPLLSVEHKMFYVTQISIVLLTMTLCSGLFG
ncbi:MAG: cytochrome c biogenesis protein CcsA [Symbiopectobacterium sp.]